MGRRHEQIFLQRRHTDDQQTHEKLLNITDHEGNANQNHSETTSHLSECLKLTTQETSVDKDMEKKEPSCTVDGSANWCSHCQNSMEGPQEVKNRTTLQIQ